MTPEEEIAVLRAKTAEMEAHNAVLAAMLARNVVPALVQGAVAHFRADYEIARTDNGHGFEARTRYGATPLGETVDRFLASAEGSAFLGVPPAAAPVDGPFRRALARYN